MPRDKAIHIHSIDFHLMLYQVTSIRNGNSFKQMVLVQLGKLLCVFQLYQAINLILTLSTPGSVLGVDSVSQRQIS